VVNQPTPPGDAPGGELHPAAALGVLADESRLSVLAAIILGAADEHAVSTSTGLEERAVRRALARLVSGGLLIAKQEGGWRIAMDSLKQAARRATRLRPEVTPEDVGATPEQTRVLRGFLDDGRLVSIPAAHGKRMVVLDWLAQQFQPGKVYPESQVNQILQRYHADFAALRRYLVDEEFLERREGFYWRAGGTFELD
jgi:hypothetical protein